MDWFCRLHADDAATQDLARFQQWLESDAGNAAAYREVYATWSDFGRYASSPEIMAARRDVLELARRAGHGHAAPSTSRRARWAAAAILVAATITLGAAATLYLGSRPDLYSTRSGERRTVTLADGSVITLDANTRMRVRFGKRERLIALDQGQAYFDVAKDPSRPFRIRSGDETIVALGTRLNVDLFGRDILIALIEGHVAVFDGRRQSAQPAQRAARTAARTDLTTGEALRVRPDGGATLLPRVNTDQATAWVTGHLVFDDEPLLSAAERVSRYTPRHIEVSPSLAQIRISGIFDVGDADAFIEAVTSFFPVMATRPSAPTIYLVPRATSG